MCPGKLLYLALAIVAKMQKCRTAAQQTRWRVRVAGDNYCKQETSVRIGSSKLAIICIVQIEFLKTNLNATFLSNFGINNYNINKTYIDLFALKLLLPAKGWDFAKQ